MPSNNHLFYLKLNIYGRITQAHVPFISSLYVSNFKTHSILSILKICCLDTPVGGKPTAFMIYCVKIHRKYCHSSGTIAH